LVGEARPNPPTSARARTRERLSAARQTAAGIARSNLSEVRLRTLDARLIEPTPRLGLLGVRRLGWEFFLFGLKQARACLFAGLFFGAIFAMPRAGLLGIARYDMLFLWAVAIQAAMVLTKIETLDELKAVCLFHAMGFCLEAFKTSALVGAWAYPDVGYTKILGVPLFSGFMYAAVGSYMIQAWRLFDLRVVHHPPYPMAWAIALAIYANFFTNFFIGDYRWYIAACALGLYARATVEFRPFDKVRRMPLLLSFVLIGYFIWVAENLGTFFSVWRYPNQLGAWSTVNFDKWSSWSLLVIMTFTIVASLKHIKERIHIPE
jgi:uncharacterized membrane protein YoaT (DUF817 family)